MAFRELLFGALAFSSAAMVVALPKSSNTSAYPLTWRKCELERETKFGIDCAHVRVPLDWSKPDGDKKNEQNPS